MAALRQPVPHQALQCSSVLSQHADAGICDSCLTVLVLQGELKAMQILHNDVGRSVDEASRLLDAFQYVEEHGVVCPANWKPGEATMIAHPDKSMEYFNAASAADEEDDFGKTLLPVNSPADYKDAVAKGRPVVVRCCDGFFFIQGKVCQGRKPALAAFGEVAGVHCSSGGDASGTQCPAKASLSADGCDRLAVTDPLTPWTLQQAHLYAFYQRGCMVSVAGTSGCRVASAHRVWLERFVHVLLHQRDRHSVVDQIRR